MNITHAVLSDLEEVMNLHGKYHIDSIDHAELDNGFVTTNFTRAQLERLVQDERGIMVARENERIVCYAMAASWQFWSEWPFFAYMMERLPENSYNGQPLNAKDTYQYGPVCVDTVVRGSGVFEEVFHASLASMGERYPTMVTFINQANHRSYAAHVLKAYMTTVGEFQYGGNDYYILATQTR